MVASTTSAGYILRSNESFHPASRSAGSRGTSPATQRYGTAHAPRVEALAPASTSPRNSSGRTRANSSEA